MDSIVLSVDNLPGQALAFTNAVYINDGDFNRFRMMGANSRVSEDIVRNYGINGSVGDWVFCIRPLDKVSPGAITFSSLQRQTAMLSLSSKVPLTPYVPRPQDGLQSLTVELQLLQRVPSKDVKTIDVTELEKHVKAIFGNQFFGVGQQFAIDFVGMPFKAKVTSVKNLTLEGAAPPSDLGPRRGMLIRQTDVNFTKSQDAPLKLVGKASGAASQIFTPDFDFNKLGIGGLDREFNDIFRRAFASRLYPPSIVQQMGINHVRGMLLFGPPGCGKTLIARQIGKVLNAKEPKIVNGPEILNKFVGQSEENIRALFADAEKDYQEFGDESELHIIILDELDAITKQRGSSRDGTGVSDSIVNQFLSKIDGVNSLNNILIIGMTNRKDMIDEALLRPGRLEVHVEINLPDEKGRADILHIHTKKARDNNLLAPEVSADIDAARLPNSGPKSENMTLAQKTKNFSGAEIEGLVRAAFSHAMVRGTDGKKFQVDPNYRPQLLLQDFEQALAEVKPKFGSPVDTLNQFYKNGIISYGPAFNDLVNTLRTLIHQVRKSSRTPLLSVLLEGAPGAGKTALAASLAVESDFPLVRMISAADLVGYQESTKCNKIHTVLQALLVMIKRPPDMESHRLLVIGITSIAHELEDLGLPSVFDVRLHVPELATPNDIKMVLSDSEVPIQQSELDLIIGTMHKPIGVKKLLMVAEMARQDVETVTCARFMECLQKVGYQFV